MPNDPAKILVVDDEPAFLEVTQLILEKGGYNIVTANDGQEGFDAAISENPDLIILDINMPKMNGYEVCEKLKQEDETFSTPVIFLTARDDAGDMLRGYFSGAHEYLTKPIPSSQELLDVVAALLSQIES